MAMERFTITMTEEDIDLFERYRTDMNMSKSAFVRLLIAEHFEYIPAFLQHKELIAAVSSLDNSLKEIIQSNKRYIITISGIYYEIDRVTGEILDNFYEDMDPMQATKSVDNKDDIIIYLTTNTEKRLTTKEILYELISYK